MYSKHIQSISVHKIIVIIFSISAWKCCFSVRIRWNRAECYHPIKCSHGVNDFSLKFHQDAILCKVSWNYLFNFYLLILKEQMLKTSHSPLLLFWVGLLCWMCMCLLDETLVKFFCLDLIVSMELFTMPVVIDGLLFWGCTYFAIFSFSLSSLQSVCCWNLAASVSLCRPFTMFYCKLEQKLFCAQRSIWPCPQNLPTAYTPTRADCYTLSAPVYIYIYVCTGL